MVPLEDLPLDSLTPATLWAALDLETRRLAARCLYGSEWDSAASRAEANGAIASAMRFRPAAIGRLPLEKRVDYLSRAVRPGDSLAETLLRALHLTQRKSMLADFLDALEIPQKGGAIEDGFEVERPSRARLRTGVARLRRDYPPDDVALYLASLLAMDSDVWVDLAEIAGTTA